MFHLSTGIWCLAPREMTFLRYNESEKLFLMASIHAVKSLLPENFTFIRTILDGTYGKVILAENKDNGSYYAVKTIANNRFYEIEKTLLELPTFVHPNIVRGILYRKDDNFHQLIFEYSPGGDLFDYSRDRILNMNQIIQITGQLAKALMFIHSQGIVHGDIKVENILVHKLDPIHVKLADFGLSFSPPCSDSKRRGTYEFMSPEMISHGNTNKISFPTDMWSFGVMVYELAYNEIPFGSRDDSKELLAKRICKAKFLFPEIRPIFNDFISRLLVYEPRARMTAKQCLEHPFLKEWYRKDSTKDVIHEYQFSRNSLE